MTPTTATPAPLTRQTRHEVVQAMAAHRAELDRLSREIGAIHALLPTLPVHERAGRESEMQSLRAQAVAILDSEMQPCLQRLAELDAEELAATHAAASRDGFIATALYPKLRSHRIALGQHQDRLRQVIAARDMSVAAAERQADHLDRLRALVRDLHALAAEVAGPVGALATDAAAQFAQHEPAMAASLQAATARRDTAAGAIAEVEAVIASEQAECDRIAAEIISLQSQGEAA